MSAETIGIMAVIAVVQAGLFIKVWLNGRRAEKINVGLNDEINEMRIEIGELGSSLDSLNKRYHACTASLNATLARLDILEKFRNVAAGDSPSGDTLRAMPPKP